MVYITKGNRIITDGVQVTLKNNNYILALDEESNVMVYRLSDLATLGETFDFICRYYPDYEHCDEAAWLDDLDCIIGGECDEEKVERITYAWGSDPDVWQLERDRIYSELLKGAIENYKTINNIK